ncbi:MAG: UrcA family protein [Formivibrio sp.]|nr:UrcA family protein [Formivibrio sp.]
MASGSSPPLGVDRAVSFSDLNLKDSKDQDKLKQRAEDAAKNACVELDRRFPKSVYIPVPANQDCVADASSQAMVSAKKLISAAAAG